MLLRICWGDIAYQVPSDTQQQNANSALLGPEHEVRIWPGEIGWLEYVLRNATNDDHCQLGRCVPWLDSESYPGLKVKEMSQN